MRSGRWRISRRGSRCAGGASSWWRGPATAATRTSARSRRKVAGRFDHYICRRDDSLRGRAERESADDARASRCASADVPDERDRGDPRRAGGHRRRRSRMGRPGDLLLVFADALTRSWKQIIKFKPQAEHRRDGAVARRCVRPPLAGAPPPAAEERGRHRHLRRCGARGAGIRARGAGSAVRRRSGRLTRPRSPWPTCARRGATRRSLNYGFVDSRRLTGLNRYFDGPAVTLTPLGAAAGDPRALEAWAERVRRSSTRARLAGAASRRSSGAPRGLSSCFARRRMCC